MSPQENYLAVVTSHTVHILLLPDSSHLTAPEAEPLKPKAWQLGPTIHVTSKSAIARALFHPLGVNGCTLVTVTEDADVRLWEFNSSDRWTFDSPTLSIDLKKLADGISLDQDFTACTAGTKPGFSPDAIEMQVASACFASQGSGGWSAMTLWVAMCEGDVYALCPLLPNKWAPPPTLITSLSVSIVSKVAAIEDDPEVSPRAKQLVQQQLDWMAELDTQNPTFSESSLPGEPAAEVFKRPTKPGAVPKLQGPFEIALTPQSEGDDDMDNELTDIFVIGEKLDTNDLVIGENSNFSIDNNDEINREGLCLSVVCLLSASGQLRACLDTNGVEAQWLPPPRKMSSTSQPMSTEVDNEDYELLCFQTLSTLYQYEVVEESWPMFSPDVLSRYAFYVTHASSITYISLAPWVSRLATELDESGDSTGEAAPGSDFRIELLTKGQNSERERLYAKELTHDNAPLAATTALRDPDLGYMLLSATPFEPVCVVLNPPEEDLPVDETRFLASAEDDAFSTPTLARADSPSPTDERKPIEWREQPRPLFMPPYAFEQPSALPQWLEQLRTSKHRLLVDKEVRLSPATLGLFTEVHRILAEETSRINKAAAELFRKAHSLQQELHTQIIKAKEIRDRVDEQAGLDNSDPGGERFTKNDRVEARLAAARTRQEKLAERLDVLRKKVARVGARPLSDKEKAFVQEVHTMHANIIGTLSADGNGESSSNTGTATPSLLSSFVAVSPSSNTDSISITGKIKTPKQRYDEVMALKDELLNQVNEAQKTVALSSEAENDGMGGVGMGESFSSSVSTYSNLRIPTDVRKAKLTQVRNLLERETALVEGVKARVERLSLG